MKVSVRKNPRVGPLTPETTSTNGYRVTVYCEKCCVPKPITITPGRYAKVWTQPWETVFERVRFRCRCGTLANAMQVHQLGHDLPKEVLAVWARGAYHG